MPSQPRTTGAVERYRRERPPCSREFALELARITDEIDDPVTKLRCLRTAIGEGDEDVVRRLPHAGMRRALYRLRGLEALDAVLEPGADQGAVSESARAVRRRIRRVATGTVAATLLLVPALLTGLALRFDSSDESVATQAAAAQPNASAADSAPETAPLSRPEPPAPAAEVLPRDAPGVTPSTIWMADRGPGWELYSNGLRIETMHVVKGEPRRYRVHHRTTGLQKAIYTQPIGILFHTSESDLWPLEEAFGQDLRRSSAGLLRYIRKERAYNYVIDRFGRVYRVVDDETRARHAGRGVWARNDEVYLDLNNAFLGISFESRWEGGRTLPITRAQLIAGRNLTHYLRQRFAIAPEMCVTHGLTSVNPKRKLIAYHRDWARGFPFDAFGLPDLYAAPTPSVALFGFGYDADFLRAVGERWPGLIAAEQSLAADARARSMTLDALRLERQELYLKWSRETPPGESAASALADS